MLYFAVKILKVLLLLWHRQFVDLLVSPLFLPGLVDKFVDFHVCEVFVDGCVELVVVFTALVLISGDEFAFGVNFDDGSDFATDFVWVVVPHLKHVPCRPVLMHKH